MTYETRVILRNTTFGINVTSVGNLIFPQLDRRKSCKPPNSPYVFSQTRGCRRFDHRIIDISFFFFLN